MSEILKWKDIAAKFTDGLLLGNGASIALHDGFRYDSLYEAAKDLGHLSAEVIAIFGKFSTDDFELVLRRLWQAQLVNQALAIESEKIEQAYLQVRQALIATVRDNHISYDAAVPYLPAVYGFMQQFKTVLSLNYDLIVYWAMMASRDTLRGWFKDAFNGSTFRENWEEMREPYRADGTSLVFYPHGNLVLARNFSGGEVKLSVGSGPNLLNSILTKWEDRSVTPLFVSEGTSADKKRAIEGTSYMHRVLREVIPKIGGSLVVYGWSVSDQDQHILQQLRHSGLQRVAVSVRGDDAGFRLRIRQAFESIGVTDLVFFDSDSPGCWPQAEKATE